MTENLGPTAVMPPLPAVPDLPFNVIAVAMPEEAAPFTSGASSLGEPWQLGAGEFQLWQRPESNGVFGLLRTGIGTVNAASSLAALLMRVRPAGLISAGTCGGLAANVQVGAVIVGSAYRYHAADATAFGYEPGQIPQMPASFVAGPGLLERARAVAGAGAAGPGFGQVLLGEILSGDSFVTAENVGPVRATFPAAVGVDMESAALAQVAYNFGIEFLSVRGVTDLCGPEAAADHDASLDDVAARSAALCLALL